MSPNTELGKIVKRHNRIIDVILGIIAVAAVGSLIIGFSNKGNLAHNVYTSCVVQARGLKSAPFQRIIYEEIDGLLTPVPGQPHPKLPKVTADHVFNLKWALDHYIAIQQKQPKTRKC
jgi:hypothetical protein